MYWRKLHKVKLRDFYFPNALKVNKSRSVRWSGHVTHITGFWWGNVKEETNLKTGRSWEDNIKMDTIEIW